LIFIATHSRGVEQQTEAARRLVAIASTTVIACYGCERKLEAREFDGSGTDPCPRCYKEAGLENEHQDGYHREQPNADCPMCEVPQPGRVYRLTGGPNDPALSNGNTWSESEVHELQ
jgi:hypothetical protein